MASIFEGIKFETPTDVQERILREQQAMLAQMNSRQAAGFVSGQALARLISRFRTGERGEGFFNRLRTGTADPRIREAEQVQEVLGAAQQVAQAEVEAGTDPTIARIQAMRRAASEFASMGRTDLAAQLQAQALTLQSQFEVHQAELNKLRADTRLTEVKTEQLLNPPPEEPKDELTRMQDQRERLTALLHEQDNLSGPAAQYIAQRIDEVNQRIQKIITITGRTEHDVGAQKSTLAGLERNLVETQATLDQLTEAIRTFDPTHYTLGGRIEGGFLRFKDILGLPLLEEEKRELTVRTENLMAMNQLLNDYIHQITGAQVGQKEEQQRLSRAVPTPGDSPTVLATKMRTLAWMLPAIQARTRAALAAGDVTIINTPLEQFRPSEDTDALYREALEILSR